MFIYRYIYIPIYMNGSQKKLSFCKGFRLASPLSSVLVFILSYIIHFTIFYDIYIYIYIYIYICIYIYTRMVQVVNNLR